MARAVFIDRDGVLNRAIVRDGRPFAPLTVGEFKIVAGVPEGCSALAASGFLVVVVTNQPDIGRGNLSISALNAMHQILRDACRIDDIFVCPHGRDGECTCRKPLPGLLRMAAEKWNIDLEGSFMIGDRWRDVQCAINAGCVPIFIDAGYSEQQALPGVATVSDFPEAVKLVTSNNERGKE